MEPVFTMLCQGDRQFIDQHYLLYFLRHTHPFHYEREVERSLRSMTGM